MATDPLREAASLHQSGDLAAAARLYEQILAQRPMHAGALGLSGLLALDQGDAAKAAQRLGLAASLEQRNPSHAFGLGEALRALGRHDEALAAYRNAVRLDGRNALFQTALGVALKSSGAQDEALAALRRAVSLDAGSVPALVNLGALQLDLGELERAAETLGKACARAPGHAEALYNLATALFRLDRYDEALDRFRAALAADPRHRHALNNFGLCLAVAGQDEAALDAFERALAVDPGWAEALYNRGNALKSLGRFADAVASYDDAIARDPGRAEILMNRGLARLTQGAFAPAWRDYLHRKLPRGPEAHPRAPLPADLGGRRFFIRREQGLGDELFFLRFAPLLAARGATIIAETDPRIAALVARSAGIAGTVAMGAPAPPEAEPLWLADLPLLAGHAAAGETPPPLALTPLAERRAAMQVRLAMLGPGPAIGITWRAGARKGGGFAKAIGLDVLARALSGVAGTLVALQRHPAPGEIDALAQAIGRPVHDLTAVNDDLEDMLALMAVLDDYVAVSNANVHLRAGVSQRCRVLVPFPPEYRWMETGEASPWFPGFTVYRAAAPGDWGDALDRLTRDLGAGPPAAMQFPAS